eukprot:2767703-Prymnesium_polylepis.3
MMVDARGVILQLVDCARSAPAHVVWRGTGMRLLTQTSVSSSLRLNQLNATQRDGDLLWEMPRARNSPVIGDSERCET